MKIKCDNGFKEVRLTESRADGKGKAMLLLFQWLPASFIEHGLCGWLLMGYSKTRSLNFFPVLCPLLACDLNLFAS